MEDQQETVPTQEEIVAQPLEPTKSVKTFWERLDEVLTLNLQSQQMRDRVETLLEEFPDSLKSEQNARSFLFQPERIVLSSNDDVIPPSNLAADYTSLAGYQNSPQDSEYFSSFRIRFQRALVRVKSIQLLSAVIPNAVQNIPDNSTYFFYYKIRNIADSQQGAFDLGTLYAQGDFVISPANITYVCQVENNNVNPSITYWTSTLTLPANPNDFLGDWSNTRVYGVGDVGKVVRYQGNYWVVTTGSTNIVPGVQYWVQTTLPADTTRPNYYDIGFDTLQYVRLLPSTTLFEAFPVPLNNPNFINRTFTDYQDLLGALQFCATQPGTASIPGDVSFQYNAQLNKFIFVPNVAANPNSYYFPAGFEDPNVTQGLYLASVGNSTVNFTPGYTLNLRLGFTWNGLIPNPFLSNPFATIAIPNVLYSFMRPIDPIYLAPPYNKQNWGSTTCTANSYGDLVNTSCVRVYADVTLGSTQDSNSKNFTDAEGILSIVPVNTTNLGVAFYQNNFNNELTKIPSVLTEIGIRLVNDQGLPYLLPNSATVLLELAVTYE